MAIGSTTALLEPSPAPMPAAAASTMATNTAANVATFVQSTRGAVVSSAVAMRWCYDWGRLRAARRLRHAIGAAPHGGRHDTARHGDPRLPQDPRQALLGAGAGARHRGHPAHRLVPGPSCPVLGPRHCHPDGAGG